MLTRPEHNQPQANSPHQRANGTGRLSVVETSGKTQIDELYQEGCAKIRIPRSHDNSLEAVIINSSGGMTGGDKLSWDFNVAANCNTSITTQACERIYKSTEGSAQTNVRVRIAARAQFSWLPQETILFNQASLTRTIEADLESGAEALFVEPLIFGRHKMGERISKGVIHDRWRIRQNGQLLHAEDLHLSGDIAQHLSQPFITNSNEAIATLLLISPKAEGHLQGTRDIIRESGGASFWNGKLLVRIAATGGYELQKKLTPLINLLNFDSPLPKIWSL